MTIRSIASGSAGNCYYVSDGKTGILLDCGIPIKKIKEWLWHNSLRLSDISCCLVTHEHGDHVKAAQKLADNGVEVFASQGTIEAAGLVGRRVHGLELMKICYIADGIGCTAFDVEHDAAEPTGFLVNFFKIDESLAYVTDAAYCKYKLDGATHLMIEVNYDPDIIAGNIEDGVFPATHARRVLGSHMSIDTTLLTLERMDRSRLREVWLLHLSNDNAGDDFKRRVQELCGCEVYVA